MVFQLRYLRTLALVHTYPSEGAALAFVRDVVRFGSREDAAGFVLIEEDAHGQSRVVAEGAVLVTRALEDRAS